jgi:hypothetical protein
VQKEGDDLVTVSLEEGDLGPHGFIFSARLPVVIVDDEDLQATALRTRLASL